MIIGWLADTTCGETSEDWKENMAGWENMMGVQGAAGGIVGEDVGGKGDGVEGGADAEDKVWDWGEDADSNGVGVGVEEVWVDGRGDGVGDRADVEDKVWDWGVDTDSNGVGDGVDEDWFEEGRSRDVGEVTETRCEASSAVK